MSCLDPLVKIDNSSEKLAADRKRFDFDLNGRITALGFFKRAHRTLLVDNRVKVHCTTELRLPDRDWDSIRVEIVYTAQCPHSGEEALAKALYHHRDEPKQVLDRIINECALNYVHSVGEQRFFDDFYSRHQAGLRLSLPGCVAGRGSITLDELDVRVKAEVSPNVSIHFNSEPFDLADNCLGVPLIVQVDFEVDMASPSARGRALQRAGRLSAFEKNTHDFIKAFFRKIPLHRVHRQSEEVSQELKAELKPSAELEGRAVSRIVIALDLPADQVVSLDSKFECGLADSTDLSVEAIGSLWITDVARTVARTDWKKREELQTKLSVILQAHAREIIGKYSYIEFHTNTKSVWEEIARALQSEGSRLGVRVSLNWRAAWPFQWLLAGESISRIVECEVGEERVQCKLLVAMHVQLVNSSGLRDQPSGRDDLLAAIGETVEHTAKHLLQASELSTYYALEAQFREGLEKEISGVLLNKFGLRATGLRFQRKDNLAAQNMVDFVQHAPMLRVPHPTLSTVVYEVHYRVLAYASSVGFPVFPKDISAVSLALETAIRQLLDDLPPQMLIQTKEKKDALQKLARERLPKEMEARHRLRVEILNWITTTTAKEDGPTLLDILYELIHRLAVATDPMDREDMKKQISQIARLLVARSTPVPFDDLEAVGVDCTRLLPPPPSEEQKALPANADQ